MIEHPDHTGESANPNAPWNQPDNPTDFTDGQRVRHDDGTEGTVMAIHPSGIVEVEFDDDTCWAYFPPEQHEELTPC